MNLTNFVFARAYYLNPKENLLIFKIIYGENSDPNKYSYIKKTFVLITSQNYNYCKKNRKKQE